MQRLTSQVIRVVTCTYIFGWCLLRPETYQIICNETTYLMAFLVSECNKATKLSLLIMLREYR